MKIISEMERSLSPIRKVNSFFQENLPLFGLWLFFRIFTSAIAAVSSSLNPITEIERRVALWPPSFPLNEWLERVFISPWNRWDVKWYSQIINQGYSKDDGTANFHPLFPWLGKFLSYLSLNPEFSLLIISTISTLLFLYVYKKFFISTSNKSQTNLILLIILVFPTSFILFAPYPESLFLLLSMLCFYFLRLRKWGLAGISGFFAVLTRQQGILLIFPYVWELWYATGKKYSINRYMWQNWLTVLFLPLAFALWIGYRLLFLGEMTQKVNSIQEIIYSIFISPNANKIVPNQSFLWPWKTLAHSLDKIIFSPDLDIWTNIILAFLFVLIIVYSWKNLAINLQLYSIIIYFVSFSYFTGNVHPLMGLPRHLSLAFPIFAGITPLITKYRLIRWSYLSFSILFMAFLIIAYTSMAWVP